MSSKLAVTLIFSLAALFLAAASWLPETLASSFFGVCCIACLSYVASKKEKNEFLLSNKKLYFGFFIFGLSLSILSNYWLPDTITLFGGFPLFISWLLFILFSCLSSFQYLLLAFLLISFRKITFSRYNLLHLPLAWFLAEAVFPRLFPWKLPMMQVYWESFSSLAEIFGLSILSFILVYWVECAVNIKKLSILSRVVFLLSFSVLFFGKNLSERVREEVQNAPLVRAGVIQGNISAEEKHELGSLSDNLKIYQGLSKSAEREGAEILFWPESVMTTWLPLNQTRIRGNEFDPFPAQTIPLLYGGLSYEPREESQFLELSKSLSSESLLERLRYHSYNSAIYLEKSGEIVDIYHKQVLMPFGEYLPFRTVYPKVRELSPYSGDFTAGKSSKVFTAQTPGKSFKFSVLICYEDMISRVSKESAAKGANFLVNISNDAWYGTSVASKQHHMLAMWRSIETRRALVRVTNNGFSALVSPLGKTEKTLKRFIEDFMVVEVPLLERETFFVKYNIERKIFYLAMLIILLASVLNLFYKSSSKK